MKSLLPVCSGVSRLSAKSTLPCASILDLCYSIYNQQKESVPGNYSLIGAKPEKAKKKKAKEMLNCKYHGNVQWMGLDEFFASLLRCLKAFSKV